MREMPNRQVVMTVGAAVAIIVVLALSWLGENKLPDFQILRSAFWQWYYEPSIKLSKDGTAVIMRSRAYFVVTPWNAMRLQTLLDETSRAVGAKQVTAVQFDAVGGGDVEGATKMAMLLNDRGLYFRVATGTSCASGCAAAFALTKRQDASDEALFNLHPTLNGPPLLKHLYAKVPDGQRVIHTLEGCTRGNPLMKLPSLWLKGRDFKRLLHDPEATCDSIDAWSDPHEGPIHRLPPP